MSSPDDLLTTREAAAMLRLKPRTLQTYRQKRTIELPTVDLGHRTKLYRRGDVQAYIDRHLKQPQSVTP